MKKIILFTAFMLTSVLSMPLFAEFESTPINDDVIIVTDTKTGFVWQGTYVSGKTWQQALDYCENLTYAGFTDWRLPNKNELVSLLNDLRYRPVSSFPDMPSQYFWSSSSSKNTTSSAWYVDFDLGNVKTYSKTTSLSVRCVR